MKVVKESEKAGLKFNIKKTKIMASGPITSWQIDGETVRDFILDHKEGWAQKNRCFQIVVLEKTLESPLDCKEIKPVNLKGNQPWNGRTDGEAPVLTPPDSESWLTGKDHDAGKDWGYEEKGVTEDKMV